MAERARPLVFLVSAFTLLAGCGGGDGGDRGDARADGARDAGTTSDAIAPDDAVTPFDIGPPEPTYDAGPDPDASGPASDGGGGGDGGDGGSVTPMLGPTGGTVDLLRFGVFGDIRPPLPDENGSYPIMTVNAVMAGMQAAGAQFAVSSGDYMNANFCDSCVTTQLGYLQTAERMFGGRIYHSMGNHECFTVTTINCPNENESAALRGFRGMFLSAYAHVYYDYTIHTRMGDAHFIATAPNAWSDAQRTWLDAALAVPARYTFVIAHEPPGSGNPAGADAVEAAMMRRTAPITMRLYGHVHNYQHVLPNAIITGNAGAPLEGTGAYFGFVVINQRDDGNLVVAAYEIGSPPMVRDTFVLTPEGTPTH